MKKNVASLRILTALCFGLLILVSCQKKAETSQEVSFTKIDSLTEHFLELHDSMLYSWNKMMSDENQKIRAMNNLLHELKISSQFDRETLEALEHRLSQVKNNTITPESIDDNSVVEEYDFATNTLVTELLSMAESHEAYLHNKILQKMVEEIKLTDQRMEENRNIYDAIASEYNNFVETNKLVIWEIDRNASLEKKPLFQAISDE